MVEGTVENAGKAVKGEGMVTGVAEAIDRAADEWIKANGGETVGMADVPPEVLARAAMEAMLPHLSGHDRSKVRAALAA